MCEGNFHTPVNYEMFWGHLLVINPLMFGANQRQLTIVTVSLFIEVGQG